MLSRILLAALIATVISACGSGISPSKSGTTNVPTVPNPPDITSGRDYFVVPSAAFKNTLGNFPANAPCTPVEDFGDSRCTGGAASGPVKFSYGNPASQPGLGIAVGGIGAGSFMINQAGSFGPWNFGGSQPLGSYENRIIPQAAFHIREVLDSGTPTVTTLATNDTSDGPNTTPWGPMLSGWSLLKKGDAQYSALWPFGWISYPTLKADVSMQFWSPIVARQDEKTSMPVVYFDVRVANHTANTDHLSVMFTMPNAKEHDGNVWQFPISAVTPPTVRNGLTSTIKSDPVTNVTGVVLGSNDANNSPDALKSEWVIAAQPDAQQHVSYVTSWNASGDGSDIYAPFIATGTLPNNSIDTTNSAGAILLAKDLAPGEVTTFRFVLAWDFPQVTFGSNAASVPGPGQIVNIALGGNNNAATPNGSIWMRRYTSFFGALEDAHNNYIFGSYPFNQGFNIANQLLSQRDASLAAVKGWWNKIVQEPAYPDWLKMAALNEMYIFNFAGSFWESGLVKGPTPTGTGPRPGAQVRTHLFHNVTSGGWDDANEWDVDSLGWLSWEVLFPNLARDHIVGRMDMIAQDPNGIAPHVAGNIGGAPWITWAASSGSQQTNTTFFDIAHKDVFRAYAHYKRSGDASFLAYAYPSMLKTFNWTRSFVQPQTHLPFSVDPIQQNTYDTIPAVGYGLYNCQLYLLSLAALIDATPVARAAGVAQATQALEDDLKNEFRLAKAQFEQVFWNDALSSYQYHIGNAVFYFVDTFFAQRVAEILGLPDLVDPDHMHRHLVSAASQLTQGTPLTPFIGVPNLVPVVGPYMPSACAETCEIWPGSNYQAAAQYYGAGVRFKDKSLQDTGLKIGKAMADLSFANNTYGFTFGTPESIYPDNPTTYRSPGYIRTRAVLDLLYAIKPLDLSDQP